MAVTIAPWLHPPDFVGAMSAGAQAGLAARREDQQQIEAGDRLRRAYDQLASNERREQEAAAAKMQLAQASQALKAQALDATNTYHQGQLDARAEADAFHRDNMQRLTAQFAEREQRMKEQFGQSLDLKDSRENRLADQFSQRMDEAKAREDRLGKQFKERMAANPGKLDPASAALLGLNTSELRSTRNQIYKIDDEGGPKRNWLGLGSGNTDTYKALKAREADLLKKIQSYKPAAASDPSEDETPSPGKAQFRFDPESGTIKAIGE